MKECPNCKTMLEDDELFCHECGEKCEINVENQEEIGSTFVIPGLNEIVSKHLSSALLYPNKIITTVLYLHTYPDAAIQLLSSPKDGFCINICIEKSRGEEGLLSRFKESGFYSLFVPDGIHDDDFSGIMTMESDEGFVVKQLSKLLITVYEQPIDVVPGYFTDVDNETIASGKSKKIDISTQTDTYNDNKQTKENTCIHCGEIIEEDSAFCPYCGKSQFVEEVKKPEPEVEKEPVSEEKPEFKQEEKPAPEEKEGPKEAPVQEIQEEHTTYEWEEEPKSKKWIWILLVALLAGAGAWYIFSQNSYSLDGGETAAEAVDSTLTDEPDEIDEYEETTPTSPLAFLEQFYKGDIKDEYYISQNVTANVLNKLKQDYEYECPSGDCLATWVFTAYPPGSDLYLEEGPIITESKEEGKYSVYYSYYIQGQSGRIYKPRGLLVSVTQIDGKYLISDYELVMPDMEQNQDDMPDNNEEYESQKMGTGEDMHTTQANSTQEKQQYSAFFVYGTATELKEFDILDDGGRLRPNFNKDYFTKIDTRTDKEIKLYSKSAKILTTHPSNSYTLKTNEHNQYELSIIDPQRFWSSSMYLVILVK